jgi:hypothetical protein
VSWYHNLAIVKSVAINMGVQVSLLHADFDSLSIRPGEDCLVGLFF